MEENSVKELCGNTKLKLKEAITKLEVFLNHFSLDELTIDSEETQEFYQGYLSDLRHLLVFSEVAFEKLGVILRRPNFKMENAEKVLYDIYHNAVNHFFYPKHESYSEDGRYAYTGKDAIRFRKETNPKLKEVTLDLSVIYEQIRDDLGYYENEYISKRHMQGNKG